MQRDREREKDNKTMPLIYCRSSASVWILTTNLIFVCILIRGVFIKIQRLDLVGKEDFTFYGKNMGGAPFQ